MKSKHDCIGCKNNFYNGNNSIGVKECSSYKRRGRLVVRYRISYNSPMDNRYAYQKVKVPACYHGDGYAYLENIPHYAKPSKLQIERERRK